jgi:hypothetical protein
VRERGSAFPFAIPQHFYQTEIKKKTMATQGHKQQVLNGMRRKENE